jgi:hypothetical protein
MRHGSVGRPGLTIIFALILLNIVRPKPLSRKDMSGNMVGSEDITRTIIGYAFHPRPAIPNSVGLTVQLRDQFASLELKIEDGIHRVVEWNTIGLLSRRLLWLQKQKK